MLKCDINMVCYKETISVKKQNLSDLITRPMELLAEKCSIVWENHEALTALLRDNIFNIPHRQLLYATDTDGTQISANVLLDHVDDTARYQDLSHRPFLRGILPFRGLVLSEAYLSQQNLEPCITAIQAVVNEEKLLGFIVADFNINDLPVLNRVSQFRPLDWQQFRGDPAIREQLFQQERITSVLDENTDFLYLKKSDKNCRLITKSWRISQQNSFLQLTLYIMVIRRSL